MSAPPLLLPPLPPLPPPPADGPPPPDMLFGVGVLDGQGSPAPNGLPRSVKLSVVVLPVRSNLVATSTPHRALADVAAVRTPHGARILTTWSPGGFLPIDRLVADWYQRTVGRRLSIRSRGRSLVSRTLLIHQLHRLPALRSGLDQRHLVISQPDPDPLDNGRTLDPRSARLSRRLLLFLTRSSYRDSTHFLHSRNT